MTVTTTLDVCAKRAAEGDYDYDDYGEHGLSVLFVQRRGRGGWIYREAPDGREWVTFYPAGDHETMSDDWDRIEDYPSKVRRAAEQG